MNNDPIHQEFLRVCQETMDFLKSHDFSEGRLAVDPAVHQATVSFHGKTLVIECIWDSREEALDVKVARLEGGQPATQYHVDPTGRKVRDHVTQILLRRSVRGFGFRKIPPNTASPRHWRIKLEDMARLLQEHGQAILRQEEVLD